MHLVVEEIDFRVFLKTISRERYPLNEKYLHTQPFEVEVFAAPTREDDLLSLQTSYSGITIESNTMKVAAVLVSSLALASAFAPQPTSRVSTAQKALFDDVS